MKKIRKNSKVWKEQKALIMQQQTVLFWNGYRYLETSSDLLDDDYVLYLYPQGNFIWIHPDGYRIEFK